VFGRILAKDRPVGAVDHPLDFVCIPLVRTRLSGLCGHIWSSNRGAPTIHAHSWHLYSEVILGSITNEVFQAVRQPAGEYHIVRIQTADRTDLLTPTGAKASVVNEMTEICRTGGSYTLKPGTFHRSTPIAEGLTLTLVQAKMLVGQHDQVLVRSPGPVERTRRRQLPERRALGLVAMFTDAIDAGRCASGRLS
jgi:hypothetical protein